MRTAMLPRPEIPQRRFYRRICPSENIESILVPYDDWRHDVEIEE